MFTVGGKLVAGIGPLQNPQQPPVWSTYINVDDADDVVAKALAAGGQAAMGPFDVTDAGRMAILVDPTGAFFGIWQAGRHHGAEVVSEAGALGWNELTTRDIESAKTFYTAVFGWEPEPWTAGETDYTVWNVDGQPIAGLMEMDDQWPEGIPSHWMVSSSTTPTRPSPRRRSSAAQPRSRPSTCPASAGSPSSTTPTEQRSRS